MPEDLKLSQIGSSPLPPLFRGLHSPGIRKPSNYLRLLFSEIIYFLLNLLLLVPCVPILKGGVTRLCRSSCRRDKWCVVKTVAFIPVHSVLGRRCLQLPGPSHHSQEGTAAVIETKHWSRVSAVAGSVHIGQSCR